MCMMSSVRPEGKAFIVILGINLQMWTDLYVEPEVDKPETYEDENKRFVLTKFELNRCVDKAIKQAKEMQQSVSHCILLERAGFTYAEVHKLTTGEEQGPMGIIVPSDNKYQADEDLATMYESLGEIWWFVSQARDVMRMAD